MSAKLSSGGKVVSEIGQGLFGLVGITHGDNEVDVDDLVKQILKLKLFDEEGVNRRDWGMNIKEANK